MSPVRALFFLSPAGFRFMSVYFLHKVVCSHAEVLSTLWCHKIYLSKGTKKMVTPFLAGLSVTVNKFAIFLRTSAFAL